MAKRLMSLQRQRLAESQLLDRRARRVLHDDVLPRLHTAMLTLSSRVPAGSAPANGGDDQSDALALLAGVHRQISDLLRDMPAASAPDVARLGLLGALRREVEGELGGAFDDVTWEIDPVAAQAAETIPQLTAEVLFYAAREAVRNAARHGRGSDPGRPLHLRIALRLSGGLELAIEDDGVGLGMSATGVGRQNGGSGQGLALHSTMMAVVGGTLAADSLPGAYTRITLSLPFERLNVK
jgi:signal transduction histidine kinase